MFETNSNTTDDTSNNLINHTVYFCRVKINYLTIIRKRNKFPFPSIPGDSLAIAFVERYNIMSII